MIRVIHHIADVPSALEQIRSVMAPNATFVLEYANKRNLKALARYALRRQKWNPGGPEPVEFVELNFNFHPTYMAMALHEADFTTQQKLAVSYFRVGVLKRVFPAGVLAALDDALQEKAPLYSPSVFTQNVTIGGGPDNTTGALAFRCPTCGANLVGAADILSCTGSECGLRWKRHEGIYDFKEPLG